MQDRDGNLYLALGSDYQQPERPSERSLWRGKVLKVDLSRPRGERVEPFGHELRFPQGIAIDSQDRLFVTDQQGVANTFNEINHILPGRHYGVEAMHEEDRDVAETRPAVQVPHPWTRSVNGLMFLPDDLEGPLAPFAGHGVGAEYNSKFLIRISLQEVDGELQGATYYLSRPTWEDEANTFLGPMCVALGPTGDLYVGSIHDSGWLGGQNTGEIVRLSPNGEQLPNGIRELRGTPWRIRDRVPPPGRRRSGEGCRQLLAVGIHARLGRELRDSRLRTVQPEDRIDHNVGRQPDGLAYRRRVARDLRLRSELLEARRVALPGDGTLHDEPDSDSIAQMDDRERSKVLKRSIDPEASRWLR